MHHLLRTILVFFCFLPVFIVAQNNQVIPLDEVAQIRLTELDNEALKATEQKRRRAGEIPAFAETHTTNISPRTDGTWTTNTTGTAIWRIRIYSKGAKSLNFGFTQYFMPEGGKLFLYTPDRKITKGPFSVADNEDHTQLWTPTIAGEEIVLEVQIPIEKKNDLELLLSAVNHDFIGFESLLSQRCNLDVNCGTEDGWEIINPYRDIIESVGMYSLNGRLLCTGFLVNNARQDCTPYYMTAAHCGVNANNAASVVVYWNFENSTCREVNSALSGQNGDGNLNQFNTGTRLIAENSNSDMTLLLLDDAVADSIGAFYAGWNNNSMIPDTVITIHHPSNDEKRISFSYQQTYVGRIQGSMPVEDSTAQYLIIPYWDIGTTEGGSSGSPLFNTTGEVIGQLFGGLASCNSQEFDYYGRVFNSWQGSGTANSRLKDWLDPDGLGLSRIKGMYKADCDKQIRPSSYQQSICVGDTARYFLTLDAGLNDRIQLSLGSLPDSIPFSIQTIDSQVVELRIFDVESLVNSATIFQFIAQDSSFRSDINLKLTVLSDSLSAVDLLFPENAAPGVSTSPTFSWFANSPELTYQFQLSTDSTFASFALDTLDLINSNIDVSNILPSTAYYWRVKSSNKCDESSWSDTFSFVTASCKTYRSNDIPIDISAGGARTYTSNLEIAEQGNIADINVVLLKGTHSWISDLQFDLISPSGTQVTLMDRICFDEQNFDTQFDDQEESAALPCPPVDGLAYQPEGNLSSFNGEFMQGNWQLSFRDHQAQDGGQLLEWGIEVCEVSKQFDISIALSQDSFLLCGQDSLQIDIAVGVDFDLEELLIYFESDDLPLGFFATLILSEEDRRKGIIEFSQLRNLSDGIYTITVIAEDGTFSSRKSIVLEISSLAAISLVKPANETTALKVDEGLFEWNGIGTVDNYEFIVATDSLLDSIVYQINTSNTFFSTNDSLLSNQNYFWQVKASNTCGEVYSPIFQFLTETVVATQNTFSFGYKIYPNPTKETIWIELERSNNRLELYSNDGRLLQTVNFDGQLSVDMSTYPSGMYWVKLINQEGIVVEKVVKN